MSNINAAIGKAQFASFPERAAIRQALGRAYNSVFGIGDSVQILPYTYEDVVPHIYPIRLKNTATRDSVKQRLLEEHGVETALHYYPNHYLTKYRRQGENLPVTEDAFTRMLTLPLHTKLTVAQVTDIAEHVMRIASA
jgi:dTDP-4-amino-4,6-dideoxygalactose transaminase